MSEREQLRISTRVMYDELTKQGAQVQILDASSSMLEYKDTAGISRLLFSTSSDKSSSVGGIIAANKARSGIIAKKLGIPMPASAVCHSFADVLDFFEEHKNIVLKPLDSSGGNGVSTHITNPQTLRIAYDYAREYGTSVIAQQHIYGSDLRMLVVAGTFRSAVERMPAAVIGDGVSSIEQLIKNENNSDLRADDSMQALSFINTACAERYLGEKIHSVPENASSTAVVGPANLSLGGTAHEATALVTQEMVANAEKIVRRLGLALCGVDMMWDKTTGKYFLIEVNGTPGVNMHNDPFWGTENNAVELYVQWLLDPTKQMTV